MKFAPDSELASAVYPAHNREPRRDGAKPSILLLHYTGMSSAAKAIDWLARPESGVSCHYVVDEHGKVTQLVPEELRAWHAGASCWRGETDINSHSIGIEIHNPGHQHGYPDFSPAQMRGLIALAQDIVRRHAIAPENVLAHSDVAPGRKIDPGEKFDWHLLATEGLGRWVRPHPVDDRDAGLGPGAEQPNVLDAQKFLRSYGYGIELTGTLDSGTEKVIQAFQLHFRPARVDGRLDRSTEITLERLIDAAGKRAAA